RRLLNRDGGFNVMRSGLGHLASLSPYHALLTMSWRRFFGLTAFFYFGANLIFAAAYLLCGPGALLVPESAGIESHFLRAFFFSVHTLPPVASATSGRVGLAPILFVRVEPFLGLFGLPLGPRLLFARSPPPPAKTLFTDRAATAPSRGMTVFESRIANARRN